MRRKFPCLVLLSILASFSILSPALADSGLFVRSGSSSISSPIANQTWLFDSVDNTIKVWDGTFYQPRILPKFLLSQSGTPGVSNDSTQSYSPGSLWFDTVAKAMWMCTDSTAGAAVWKNITASGGGSGTVQSVSGLTPLFTVSNPTTTAAFALSNAAAHTAFMNNTGGSAAPGFQSIGLADIPLITIAAGGTGATTQQGAMNAIHNFPSLAQGDVTYCNGTNWVRLGAGTNGQFLQTAGLGANPLWASASGSGTVNSGTANQLGYYAGTGTAISGNSNATISTGALTLGSSGVAGSVALSGATSGTATITAPAVAGATTIQLPATAGSASQYLQTNGAGVTTWATPAGSGTITSSTSGQVPVYTAATTVGGGANFTASAGALTLGSAANAGSIVLNGATSGTCTVKVPAVAGTSTNFQLPATNGANTNVLTTDGAGNTSWAAAGGGGGTVIPAQNDFRLTSLTLTPVPTAAVTGASVYMTPYKGTHISTYDAAVWTDHGTSELSVAVPASLHRLYDVFCATGSTLNLTAWDSGGQTTSAITAATVATPVVLTSTNTYSVGDYIYVDGIVGTLGTTATTGLNGKKWKISAVSGSTITLEGSIGAGAYTSGGTTYKVPLSRTTALVRQDGVWCQSGTLGNRYIGTIETVASGQTEQSQTREMVFNADNRVNRYTFAIDTPSSYTYASATIRAADATYQDGVCRSSWVCGLVEDPVVCSKLIETQSVTNGGSVLYGMGLNSAITYSTIQGAFHSQGAGNLGPSTVTGPIYPALGDNFLQGLESSPSSTSSTFYGPGNAGCLGDTGMTTWMRQ